MSDLPAFAAWRHDGGGRSGFEVAWFREAPDGIRMSGTTTALEDGRPWVVGYELDVDAAWRTRRARVTSRYGSEAPRTTTLEGDGRGRWTVDGSPARHLTGLLDVDLESSAMTNALPVHRMALAPGGRAAAPAAYVRARDLSVERLEQEYVRLEGPGPGRRYDYASQAFGFAAVLVYGADGLVVDYPGIAVRLR